MDNVDIQRLVKLGQSQGTGRKIELSGQERITNQQHLTGTISRETLR